MAKYRKKAIPTVRVRECLERLRFGFPHPSGTLVECDGEDDHMHLLVEMPPKIAPSVMVNSLKGVSSRLLRAQNLPEVRAKLWRDHFWSPSYFVSSTGGATLEKVELCIKNQRQGGNSSQP